MIDRICDLHCDTLYEAVKNKDSIIDRRGHLSLEKLSEFKSFIQVMAMWSDKKLTPEYFDKLSYGVGVSKRLRAEKYGAENELFADERAKRRYTWILALLYTLTLQPQKAKWLLRMRKGISKGIFEK